MEGRTSATHFSELLRSGNSRHRRWEPHHGRHPKFFRYFAASGILLGDADKATKLYNDNSACVQWSHNMTTKSMRWVELPENSIREWVQDGTLDVCHVPGVDNPSDIFTKEIRDAAHFCRLRESFMCRLSTFLRGGD